MTATAVSAPITAATMDTTRTVDMSIRVGASRVESVTGADAAGALGDG
jgi:hypothetical protein